MKINQPRRILMLGRPNSGILELLKELTGSAPTPVDESLAGLSHIWSLENNYYSVDIPIWIDEVPDMSAWQKDFLRPEAKEVTTALGAWVYCFRRPVTGEDLDSLKEALSALSAVLKKGCGYMWDGAVLAVATPQSSTPHLQKTLEEWEKFCSEHGFEYIDSEAKGRNEFGEQVGIGRLKEAIETTDWETDTTVDLGHLDDTDNDLGGESPSELDIELTEMNRELLQMKTSLGNGSDQDDDDESNQERKVEDFTSIMSSLQAIRDTGATMPEQERKVFAAQAVNKLMKTL